MTRFVILTSDSLLETSMRMECLADGIECHVNEDVDAVDAALVDLDGLPSALIDVAQFLASKTVPVLAVVGEADATHPLEAIANKVVRKPVESISLAYKLRQMAVSKVVEAHSSEVHPPSGSARD